MIYVRLPESGRRKEGQCGGHGASEWEAGAASSQGGRGAWRPHSEPVSRGTREKARDLGSGLPVLAAARKLHKLAPEPCPPEPPSPSHSFRISCRSFRRKMRSPKREFQLFIPAGVRSFGRSRVANRSLKRNLYKRTY